LVVVVMEVVEVPSSYFGFLFLPVWFGIAAGRLPSFGGVAVAVADDDDEVDFLVAIFPTATEEDVDSVWKKTNCCCCLLGTTISPPRDEDDDDDDRSSLLRLFFVMACCACTNRRDNDDDVDFDDNPFLMNIFRIIVEW
jgi:hypothetical protein